MEIKRNFNGWTLEKNKYDGFPATKEYIAFHPLYEGHYWEEFDTLDDLKKYCTQERFEEWCQSLT